VGEYKNRSNDPRITKGAKKDKYLYDMAREVALQPADTPERKRMKKDAQNYVRAFESRFQKEAFVRSGRNPYSAGGKGENIDENFVNKVAPSSKRGSKNIVERTVGKAKFAAGMKPTAKKMTQAKPAVKAGNNPVPKSAVIKVTKKLSQAPKRTPKNAQTLRRFGKKAGNK
jgi:hypothetical protein